MPPWMSREGAALAPEQSHPCRQQAIDPLRGKIAEQAAAIDAAADDQNRVMRTDVRQSRLRGWPVGEAGNCSLLKGSRWQP